MEKVKKSIPLSKPSKTHLKDQKQAYQKTQTNRLLEKGTINQKTLNLTADNIKNLYAMAYQLYSSGKYKDARALFAVLLTFDPLEFNFLYGFATCCFMLKDYQLAAENYLQCGLSDPSNPLPYFYATDCFLHQNDIPSACIALRFVIKQSSNKPEYVELKQRAQMMLDTLAPFLAKETEVSSDT